MRLERQPYRGEEDYWEIREFLRKVFLLNGRRQFSWTTARLDYWRWHVIANCGAEPIKDGTLLWRTGGGQLVAMLNREDAGHVYLQVDPRFRTPELEEELFCLAEERLWSIGPATGRRGIVTGVLEGDKLREEILTQRAYEPRPEGQAYDRYRDLTLPIPDVPVPDGYTLRAMMLKDIPSRSWASWRAFHPDAPDADYGGDDWLESFMRAPMYRRDLDLVAVDATGAVAAFCTIWYDDVTCSGYYEPVGTVPEHQRRGLCTALLHEGMHRLVERGAIHACIGGGGAANPIAEGVYSRASTDEDSYIPWVKYLDAESA